MESLDLYQGRQMWTFAHDCCLVVLKTNYIVLMKITYAIVFRALHTEHIYENIFKYPEYEIKPVHGSNLIIVRMFCLMRNKVKNKKFKFRNCKNSKNPCKVHRGDYNM